MEDIVFGAEKIGGGWGCPPFFALFCQSGGFRGYPAEIFAQDAFHYGEHRGGRQVWAMRQKFIGLSPVHLDNPWSVNVYLHRKVPHLGTPSPRLDNNAPPFRGAARRDGQNERSHFFRRRASSLQRAEKACPRPGGRIPQARIPPREDQHGGCVGTCHFIADSDWWSDGGAENNRRGAGFAPPVDGGLGVG